MNIRRTFLVLILCLAISANAAAKRDIYRSLCHFFTEEGVLSDSIKSLMDSTIIIEEILHGGSDLTRDFGIYNISFMDVYDGPDYLLIKEGEKLWVYMNWRIESVTSDIIDINIKSPELLSNDMCLGYLKALYTQGEGQSLIRVYFKKGIFFCYPK